MGINVFMGLVIGLFGGCFLAFLMEYLDSTVKSREDVEHVIGMPFLGVVPLVDATTTAALNSQPEPTAFVHAMPKSTVSECLRTIRTNLLLSQNQENPLRTLVVTSAVPREGKSFTSCNLSALIAMTGSRVLLLDADLRRGETWSSQRRRCAPRR